MPAIGLAAHAAAGTAGPFQEAEQARIWHQAIGGSSVVNLDGRGSLGIMLTTSSLAAGRSNGLR
jgi:hypothetical protein